MRVYVLGKFLQISINRNHSDDLVKDLSAKLLLSIEQDLKSLLERSLQDLLQFVQVLNYGLMDK